MNYILRRSCHIYLGVLYLTVAPEWHPEDSWWGSPQPRLGAEMLYRSFCLYPYSIEPYVSDQCKWSCRSWSTVSVSRRVRGGRSSSYVGKEQVPLTVDDGQRLKWLWSQHAKLAPRLNVWLGVLIRSRAASFMMIHASSRDLWTHNHSQINFWYQSHATQSTCIYVDGKVSVSKSKLQVRLC